MIKINKIIIIFIYISDYINFKRLNFTHVNRYIQSVILLGLLCTIKREIYFKKRSVEFSISEVIKCYNISKVFQ